MTEIFATRLYCTIVTAVVIGIFCLILNHLNFILLGALILVAILVGILFLSEKSPPVSTTKFLLLLFCAVALPRIWWIYSTDIPPISDFNLYHTMAKSILHGEPLRTYYIALFPHTIVYPYILSILYGLLGEEIIVAQLFNTLCSYLSASLIYYICACQFPERISRTAALLSGIWLSQVFFSTLVSTEALSTTLFILTSFVYLRYGPQRRIATQIVIYIMIGMLAGLSNAVRPIGLVFVIAVLTHSVMGSKPGWVDPTKKLTSALAMLLAFFLTGNLLSGSISRFIDKPEVASSYGYTLLVGSNLKSKGGWNEEDVNALYETYHANNNSLQKINHILAGKAWERILSNFPEYPRHYFIVKPTAMWNSDSYAIDWNAYSVDQSGKGHWQAEHADLFHFLSNAFYYAMLFLALFGLIYCLMKWEYDGFMAFIILIILGFISLYILTEAQPRYHYPTLPFIAIVAAFGLDRFILMLKPGQRVIGSP